jgi:hypothetical protein
MIVNADNMTTREICIKGVDGDTSAAMKKLATAMQHIRPNETSGCGTKMLPTFRVNFITPCFIVE